MGKYFDCLESLKNGFVLIIPNQKPQMSIALVQYEKGIWSLKEGPCEIEDLTVLKTLSEQYQTGVILNTKNRRWYCSQTLYIKNIIKSPKLFVSKDLNMSNKLHMKCYIHMLNRCFSSFLSLKKGLESYHQGYQSVTPVKRYYLTVPYEEKNEARALGARWSETYGELEEYFQQPFYYQWFINFEENLEDIKPLLKWANPKDHSFLIDVFERRKNFIEENEKKLSITKSQYENEVKVALDEFLETLRK